jgi:histidinol-phosphate aminotransferase
MTTHTRSDLSALPGYVPGKSVPGAVKLASNEVSAGPLPSVRTAIAEAAVGINRYPDTVSGSLVQRLAQRFETDAEGIVVGCGSVSLCQMLIQATCHDNDEVLYAWRSFEAYPILTKVVGATPVQVPLTAEHALDLDAMLAAITDRTRLIFVCTPNNPTGTAVGGDELARFVERVPEHVLVVIDEAYREFVDSPDVPDGLEFAKRQWAAGRDNVTVLRTFSKAYGLAGLRVGYCASSVAVADALRKVAVPFAVNVLAQTAAIASLDAEDELMARCRAIVGERSRVRDALLQLGYRVPPTQANFVWLPLGERTSEFNEHCLAHHVVVRAFVGDGARVTIGEPDENDTFLAAAKAFRP